MRGTTRLALLSRGFRLRQSIERPSHWGRRASPTCPGLFCKRNCEAHERPMVIRIGTDVGCKDLGPTSTRLQLWPPRHLISIRTRRWVVQTANLRCVDRKQLRMMPDGMLKPGWLPPELCPRAHQGDPRMAVLSVVYVKHHQISLTNRQILLSVINLSQLSPKGYKEYQTAKPHCKWHACSASA